MKLKLIDDGYDGKLHYISTDIIQGEYLRYEYNEDGSYFVEPIHISELERDYVNLLKKCWFTGRKDEHEIEIYEGDILEDFVNGKRYEVVWDDYGMFLYCEINNRDVGIDYYEFEDEKSTATIVVGNIYENPELLEGQSCT